MTRILVVDDEEVFLKSLVEGLQELEPDWEIEATTKGAEALRWLAEKTYDVVVTDLRMPEVDGFSILAQLSHMEPTPMVIVMSAYLSPAAEQPLQEALVDRVLEKPFDLEELRGAIKTCLAENTQGILEGISLATVLQLLEMEQRTCTLEVQAGDRTGFVYFRGGKALDARAGYLSGDAALFELLSWSRPKVKITPFCPVRKHKLSGSITSLLLEAAKAADELDLPTVDTPAPVPEQETVVALLGLAPDLEPALPGAAAPVTLTHVEAERGHILAARVALAQESQPFPQAVVLVILVPPTSPIPLLREQLFRLCHAWASEAR
jgi:CheY-like chemotaxis protein